MYTHLLFFFVTHSVFSCSLPLQHTLPSPSTSMRFPDVFPVFSVSGLSLYSQQIEAARGRGASSIWTMWPSSLTSDLSNVQERRRVQRSRNGCALGGLPNELWHHKSCSLARLFKTPRKTFSSERESSRLVWNSAHASTLICWFKFEPSDKFPRPN